MSEQTALAGVARIHPKAVVCLLSALRFHDITTQAPFAAWLAPIPNAVPCIKRRTIGRD